VLWMVPVLVTVPAPPAISTPEPVPEMVADAPMFATLPPVPNWTPLPPVIVPALTTVEKMCPSPSRCRSSRR